MQLKDTQISKLKDELAQATTSKQNLEKKLNNVQAKALKLQNELDEEKQVSKMALEDKNLLMSQRDALEKLSRKQITALEEQVQDLVSHFTAQDQLQTMVEKTGNLTLQELEDGQICLGESSTPNNGTKKNHRRKK